MGSDIENRALLGYYANSGNFLQAFRNNLSVPSLVVTDHFLLLNSCPLKIGPIACPETLVKKYHYSQHNNLEQCNKFIKVNRLYTTYK